MAHLRSVGKMTSRFAFFPVYMRGCVFLMWLAMPSGSRNVDAGGRPADTHSALMCNRRSFSLRRTPLRSAWSIGIRCWRVRRLLEDDEKEEEEEEEDAFRCLWRFGCFLAFLRRRWLIPLGRRGMSPLTEVPISPQRRQLFTKEFHSYTEKTHVRVTG